MQICKLAGDALKAFLNDNTVHTMCNNTHVASVKETTRNTYVIEISRIRCDKPVVLLRNWSFGTRNTTAGMIACVEGDAQGHPRLQDRTIWSSAIIAFYKNKVETQNTVYLLTGPMDPGFRKHLRGTRLSLAKYVDRLITKYGGNHGIRAQKP